MHLRDDERGQPVVIGALLIFTIIVLAFSGYQAFAVPNQNAQVEVDHFQKVEGQFSDLRSTIINSVGRDEIRSTSFELGTRYPSRAIALNPPPAAGRLETTDAGDIDITTPGRDVEVCDSEGNAQTRSLVYTPGYNEYLEPTAIGYESRVISPEFRGGARYEQRMVDSASNQITLYALTGEVAENGIESYSLEVNGSHRYLTTLSSPVTVTIPSRHDAQTWRTDILTDQSDVTASPDPGTDRVRLRFTGDDWEISCAVIGLDSDPTFTPPNPGGQSSNRKDVRLNGVTSLSGSQVDVEFENLDASDVNAIEARINHYNHSGTGPTEAVISEAGAPGDSATLEVEGTFETLDPAITFAGGSTTEVRLEFDDTVSTEDWFVLTIEYDNGEVGQYFISIRDPGGGSTATPSPTQTVTPTPTPDCTGPPDQRPPGC